MTADFHIKQGDTSPAIEAVLEDETGTAIDLTGSSIDFHMKNPVDGTVKVDAAGSIVNATEGRVKYAWAAGDTDTAGRYHAEWEVTYSDGTVESFPNTDYIEIKILEEVA